MLLKPALAVSLYVAGRRCLVVGRGAIAEDRAARLAAAGATVTVAEDASDSGVWTDTFAAFCCDAGAAQAVSEAAKGRGVLVWCLDRPDLSDFAMPALARRGPLQLAVSTDGAAPALARRLREQLERLLGDAGVELDALLAEMARVRGASAGDERREQLAALAARLTVEGRIAVRDH